MNDDQKHLKKMKAIKEKQDQKIAASNIERGVTILLAGPGKGKSSSAFGMLARSLGHGHKVAVVQFLKGSMSTGEELFFAKQDNVDWFAMGDGFTWETQDKKPVQRSFFVEMSENEKLLYNLYSIS
jgi:cob(I)alamin adenosyltransferase